MKKVLLITIFMIVLQSCSTTMNAVWQKQDYTSRPFKKVAIIAISKNLEVRQSLEQDIMERLQKIHPTTQFVKGLSLFPPNTSEKDWSKEKVELLFKELQIDAVLTTSLINTYISSQYVQSSGIYYPMYYNAGGYIYGTYNYLYTPGYYEKSQNFVLQSSIFDLKEGEDASSSMIWRGESEITNPSSITNGTSNYASNLVRYINKEELLTN